MTLSKEMLSNISVRLNKFIFENEIPMSDELGKIVDDIWAASCELLERRERDKQEPVGIVRYVGIGHRKGIHVSLYERLPEGVELYAAPPAPVVQPVPDDVLAALQKVAKIRLDLNDFDGDRRGIADCLGDAEEALIDVVNRRAAMLNLPDKK